MKENTVRVCFGLIIVICIAAVIVLAAIYGTRLNCHENDEELKKMKDALIPKMVQFKNIKSMTLDRVPGTGNASAYMKTIAFSQAPGKEMRATVMRLQVGPKFMLTHTSESIVVVLDGTVTIEDSSAQMFSATKGDSFYVPRGTKVYYDAKTPSFFYIVTQPAAMKYAAVLENNLKNVGSTKFERALNFDVAKPNIPLFANKYNSLSYLNDTLLSKVTGVELSGGLYLLKKGPALQYKYEYEEFKYIYSGEFHLKDSTGQSVSAKAGDLMYFPLNVDVTFTSPSEALGFFVGQRTGGSA